MLTAITKDNKNDYLSLFDKAFKALQDAGKLTPEEEEMGGFTSIEQYFTRIGDLYLIDPKYALLLPLDEPLFEINANTREIIVPGHFKKYGISVEGDTIAETLLFKINRFVDFVDLNETDVYVQWQIGDKEEYSDITFKYLDYDPELLVFAWPITNKVTETAGSLKFSVRFVKRDGVDAPITYSFNTMPATVSINKALKADLEYATEPDNAEDLFIAAITNTENTSSEDAAKVSEPSFAAPGLDLNSKDYLVSNALTLKAQANTADSGQITYYWTYSPENSELAGEWTTEDKQGTIVFEQTADTAAQAGKTYYTKTEGTPVAYEVYTGDFNATDLAAGIYERFAEYNIPASDKYIAGSYEVTAVNRVGFGSKSKKSTACVIPGPKVLNITKDLEDYGVITDGSLTLAVEAEVDTDARGDGVNVVYKWQSTTTKPVEGAEVVWTTLDTDGNQHYATTPGWYEVDITSQLNRAEKTVASKICKVTNPNVPPVLAHPENADLVILDKNTGDGVDITVELANPYTSELESEGVIYKWYSGDNSSMEEVVETSDVEGVNTNTLHVIYNGIPTVYFCKVWNILNGQESEPATSGGFFIH